MAVIASCSMTLRSLHWSLVTVFVCVQYACVKTFRCHVSTNNLLFSLCVFLCSLVALPTQAVNAQVVYFVSNDFPGSGVIRIIENGADAEFCALGLVGLDIARKRLGIATCNADVGATASRLDVISEAREVDALLLVDDRSQLSPEATQLLSGAISQMFGSEYYVTPFGMELRVARVLTNGVANLPAGFKSVVVGERLYRDHYMTPVNGDLMWIGSIDANIRRMSGSESSISPREINTDALARAHFEEARRLYEAGDYARALTLFLDLTRVPGAGSRPAYALNIALTAAVASASAFLGGDYQLAYEGWGALYQYISSVPDEYVSSQSDEIHDRYRVIASKWRIWAADAMIKDGQTRLAEDLYENDVLAAARIVDTASELLGTFPVLRSRENR